MNQLKIEKDSKKVYDIEYVSKQQLFLKGIGRTCTVCGNHIIGHPNKKYCKKTCANKAYNNKYHRGEEKNRIGLHAFIPLKKLGTKKPYRIMKVYMIKGISEEIIIKPEHKELWALLEKIAGFRERSLVVNS